MPQADYNIANQSAPDVRSEMNTIFSAIATNNSGATAPSTTFSYQWWYDTSTNILKMRNAANGAWIDVATFDQTNNTWYVTKLRVGTGVIPKGAVGMAIEGTEGTDSSTAGPHKQFTTSADNYPLYQIMNWAHDNVSQGYDAYYDGANWKSSDLGSNFRIGKASDEWSIWVDEGITPGSNVTFQKAFSMTKLGAITKPLQPAFHAYNSANDSNVTGDGTAFTIDFDSEVYDRGSNFSADTFTAPVSGVYPLKVHVFTVGYDGTQTTVALDIVTSNRTYRFEKPAPSTGNHSFAYSVDADMDASDTAHVELTVSGGNKVITVVGTAATGGLHMTDFSGFLAC